MAWWQRCAGAFGAIGNGARLWTRGPKRERERVWARRETCPAEKKVSRARAASAVIAGIKTIVATERPTAPAV